MPSHTRKERRKKARRRVKSTRTARIGKRRGRK